MKKQKKAVISLISGMVLMTAMTFLAWAGPSGPSSTGGWRQEDGLWYYYDASGRKMTGWIEIGDRHYYLYEDGHCAINEITPDGYRVDESGAWYELTKTLIGQKISVAGRYVAPADAGSGWGSMREDFQELSDAVRDAFGGTRRLSVGGDAVEYVDGENDKTLLGFYKDIKNNSYRLEVHIRFDRSSTDTYAAATYDYAVLMGLLCKISSTPDQLCEAICSAWQEENSYGINRTDWAVCGDACVQYEAGSGYGKFYIREAGR